MASYNAQHILHMKQDLHDKIWRQSKIIAILKQGKDSAIEKNYRPISLLCYTYKLYERIVLNGIAQIVEQCLIKKPVSGPGCHASANC